MKTRLTLRPGENGTKKLLARFGDRLLTVRYRYDEEKRKRFKTVEIIVDEVPWEPPRPQEHGRYRRDFNDLVGVRVHAWETDLQHRLRQAGGIWQKGERLWEVRYSTAIMLELLDRIERG